MLLKIEAIKPNKETIFKKNFFPLNPLMGIVNSFISSGTTLFSMPFFVPIQTTS